MSLKLFIHVRSKSLRETLFICQLIQVCILCYVIPVTFLHGNQILSWVQMMTFIAQQFSSFYSGSYQIFELIQNAIYTTIVKYVIY